MSKKTTDGRKRRHTPKEGSEEYDELLEQLQRLQAEFENYKKRVEKESADFCAGANAELLRRLLPVLDNFELALATVPAEEKAGKHEGLYKGVELIYAQLGELLEQEGVQAISPIGEQFDPGKHEAMLVEERQGTTKGSVIELLQKGYEYKGRILRTAKVKVAK